MQAWTRGPVCGVNNCPSRHWRLVDGRTVCRNGHVREGQVEIGEDEGFPVGRTVEGTQWSHYTGAGISQQPELHGTLRKPSTWKKRYPFTILHGTEALEYKARIFQKLLIRQVRWLIREKGASPRIEQVTKYLWTVYLNETQFVKPTQASTFKLSHLYCEVILYVACRITCTPIMFIEIMQWRRRGEMPDLRPIMRANVKTHVRDLGLNTQIKVGTTCEKMVEFIKYLQTELNIEVPEPDLMIMTCKLCRSLFLPPEVVMFTHRLLKLFQRECKRGRQYETEIDIMAAIMIAVDNVFRFSRAESATDDEANSSTHDPTADQPDEYLDTDLNLWVDLIRKVWLEEDSFSNFTEYDVMLWHKDKMLRYLSWYEKTMTDDEYLKFAAPNNRRLLAMFPMQGSGQASNSDIQLNATHDTLCELMRVMQTSTRWKSGFDKRSPVLEIPDDQLPPLLQTVYDVGAYLCEIDRSKLHGRCKLMYGVLCRAKSIY